MLDGYFRKPNGPAGTKYPVVIPFEGADTMMEATIQGGAAYVARGMAYLAVDFPGQGGALRLKDLHLPPDTDRVIKAMIDYLETRQDVDATKIGLQGISMGGYGVPRAAAGESRVKVAMMSSGSYDLGADLFDYYPPIQERVRWIIGAKDLGDARKKLMTYTMEGKATRIECPMLIGYSKDDRIMDPAGAFRLVQGGDQFEAGYGGRHRPCAGVECGRAAGDARADIPRLGDEATGGLGFAPQRPKEKADHSIALPRPLPGRADAALGMTSRKN